MKFHGRAFGGHLSKTQNPACVEARDAEFDLSSDSDDDSEFCDVSHEFPTGGGSFSGDFFGPNYSAADLGYESDFDVPDSSLQSEYDSDEELDDPTVRDGWEPPRPAGDEEDIEMADLVTADTDTPPAPRENRKIAEDRFHLKPIIESFPGGHAGKPISPERSVSAQERYGDALGNSNNIYAPFASKMDWDVAQWAKLRGSGSTAFTDLLKIEGVSYLHPMVYGKMLK